MVKLFGLCAIQNSIEMTLNLFVVVLYIKFEFLHIML